MSHFVRTYRRRKAFLDSLAVGNSVSRSAAAADGSVQNFRNWRNADPEFAKDWDEALEEGTDTLEDAAFERAVKKSDALAMFMLKARRPEKYDRASKLELSGGISVEGSKQKLLNKLARLQAQNPLPDGSPPTEQEVSAIDGPGAQEEQKLLPAPDATPVRGRKRRAAAGIGD